MAVAGGVLDARFRERSPQVRRLEVRIVAKAAHTPRILENASFDLPAAYHFSRRVLERSHAYIPGAVRKLPSTARSGGGHPCDQLRIVCCVQRLATQVLATRPSLAVDTR